MRKTTMCLALALGMAAAPAAATEVTSMDGPAMASLLARAGYSATVDQDGVGDPMVSSTAAGADFHVYMYDCREGRCGSIQFKAGFDLAEGTTPEAMNDWNRGMRYAKAWIDDERDPWLEMDIDLAEGATEAQVIGYLELWETLLSRFQDDIGF